MGKFLKIELILLLQFVLDTRSVLFGTPHEVLVHDAVIGELEHEKRSCCKVAFLRILIEVRFDFGD